MEYAAYQLADVLKVGHACEVQFCVRSLVVLTLLHNRSSHTLCVI